MLIDEFMYNHHPEQVGVWFKYNGWRYKEYYDVKLYDGTVVNKCYPNGSGFHSEDCRVSDTDVEFLKLTDYNKCYFYNDMGKEQVIYIIVKRYGEDNVPEKHTDETGKVTFTPRLK